jgi:hypothetical protein
MVAAVTGFPARSRRRPHGGPTPSRRSRRSSLTRSGANGVVDLTPFEFLDRLADLVPPTRKHWHRYHGVFAPNHKLRRVVTALAIGNIGRRGQAATGGHGGGGHATEGCCDTNAKPRSHDTSRIAWAKLLARVGEEFPLECPACGGDIRLIAFRLLSECETIPGLGTLGNLRLLRTSCPRSTSTASEPCRGRGQTKAPRRPDAERLRADTRKTPLQRGKAGGQGKAWCAPGRQEHATHEPLVSRAMLAEVSLAGLSFFL